MANTISDQAHLNPFALRQHNNKNLERLAQKQTENNGRPAMVEDSVTLYQSLDVSATYSASLSVESSDGQDQYSLLRSLVLNMFKEQGIDFKVSIGDKEIDFSTISQQEATELIAEDGYFGVEQTSDRIVDFAIAASGDDPSRLAAIKEGVEKGFNDALEAFNGWLPDISYTTYDAVIDKLDAWADQAGTAQVS